MTDQKHPMTAPEGLGVLDQSEGSGASGFSRDVIIITGMSGAGRSRAAAVLEDLNWYVVDNLPAQLLQHLVQIVAAPQSFRNSVAAVIDVRSGDSFRALDAALEQLAIRGVGHRIIFLDADDDELIRRYDAARRPHPLQNEGLLTEAITRERQLLQQLRQRADIIVDTTHTSVHELAKQIRQVATGVAHREVTVSIMSFGFKYGIPLEADHVIDLRFIANPYWVSELRHLTGEDAPVSSYVLDNPMVQEFLRHYIAALDVALVGYVEQEKQHLTLAFGCTGGRHRSVAVSEYVAEYLRNKGHRVLLTARDIAKGS